MSHKSIKRRRYNLFKVNPHCPDCGVLMVLPEHIPQEVKAGRYPPNLCTLEHTTSRLHPDRRIGGYCKNTILCTTCNNKNGRRDELRLDIEELRRRSKMHKK